MAVGDDDILLDQPASANKLVGCVVEQINRPTLRDRASSMALLVTIRSTWS